jgi:hypothetical protein
VKLTALNLIGFIVGMIPAHSVPAASLHAGKATLAIAAANLKRSF